MTGPTDGELRAASAGLKAAALGSLVPPVPAALQHAAREQAYLVTAQTIGVDLDDARQVLREVIDELAATTVVNADPYTIARRRMIEGANGMARPPEDAREAVRQAFVAGGYQPHPEAVDAWTQMLQGTVPSIKTFAENLPKMREQLMAATSTTAEATAALNQVIAAWRKIEGSGMA